MSTNTRPNVRSATIQRGPKDGSLSPTEKRQKDGLMRQFMKLEVPLYNDAAYQAGYEQIAWGEHQACDVCGHSERAHPGGRCFMKGCECWERKRE